MEYPVYAKTLTGKSFEVVVKNDTTVLELKTLISQHLPGARLTRIIFQEKDLSDDLQQLSRIGVVKESLVLAITDEEKPCHFFFALDESGSMSGGRWAALIESFVEFIDRRHKSAQENDVPIQDIVSVFFHETQTRTANCRLSDGKVVPFLAKKLSDLTPNSLVNDFHGGGNNFNNALTALEPHLQACTQYKPVLMFMTDGGDCGDGDPRGGNFRQRSYDHMKAIKAKVPELVTYVTVVFSTNSTDIDGAKAFCTAAGMDVASHYNHITEPEGYTQQLYMSPPSVYTPSGDQPAPTPIRAVYSAPSQHYSPTSPSYSPTSPSYSPTSPSYSPAAPSYGAAPAAQPHYSAISPASAQRQMASHWDSVYNHCSPQAQAQNAFPGPTSK